MRHLNQSGIVDHLKDWIDDLSLAAALLTRVPMPHPDVAAPACLARAQRAFPLIGALIGLLAGLVDLSLLAMGVPEAAAREARCGERT